MGPTILIAEDEEFIARFYKMELERHQVEVVIVHNGKEAIDYIRSHTIDLVLLDLLMPVLDGYDVLSFCKANKIRIPVVIVLTNLSGEISREKCHTLGAEDYIIKSNVDAPEMWEKVKVYLPIHRD